MDAIALHTVCSDNERRLALGMHLGEIRRWEVWDNQGCIPSIRMLMVDLRILDGPRAGDVITEMFEQGYDGSTPWSVGVNWLSDA